VTEVHGSGGPNSFIRGLAIDSALTFDPTFSDDLRNFLMAPVNDGTCLHCIAYFFIIFILGNSHKNNVFSCVIYTTIGTKY